MLKPDENITTISTRERRVHQLLKLIDELANRNMTTYEVAQLLDCKTACAQKYLQQLRDEDVIILDRHHDTTSGSSTKAVYRLSNNLDHIREFQEMIVLPKKNRSSREKLVTLQEQGSILNVTVGAAGQRIYMLADETHHAIRTHNEPVHRDPLVAALFGAASPTHGSEAEPHVNGNSNSNSNSAW